MNMLLAFSGLLPLVVFAIVDIFANMRTAIIAAIVVSVLEVLWGYYYFGEVDSISWISMGLILIMGGISLRMNNDRMLKFQPVAMAAIFALALGWFQWQGQPLLVQMMPKMTLFLPEDKRWLVSDARVIASMRRLDLLMVGVFLLHGSLVLWCALRKSTMYWLVARGVGFYALMFAALLVHALLPAAY